MLVDRHSQIESIDAGSVSIKIDRSRATVPVVWPCTEYSPLSAFPTISRSMHRQRFDTFHQARAPQQMNASLVATFKAAGSPPPTAPEEREPHQVASVVLKEERETHAATTTRLGEEPDAHHATAAMFGEEREPRASEQQAFTAVIGDLHEVHHSEPQSSRNHNGSAERLLLLRPSLLLLARHARCAPLPVLSWSLRAAPPPPPAVLLWRYGGRWLLCSHVDGDHASQPATLPGVVDCPALVLALSAGFMPQDGGCVETTPWTSGSDSRWKLLERKNLPSELEDALRSFYFCFLPFIFDASI